MTLPNELPSVPEGMAIPRRLEQYINDVLSRAIVDVRGENGVTVDDESPGVKRVQVDETGGGGGGGTGSYEITVVTGVRVESNEIQVKTRTLYLSYSMFSDESDWSTIHTGEECVVEE